MNGMSQAAFRKVHRLLDGHTVHSYSLREEPQAFPPDWQRRRSMSGRRPSAGRRFVGWMWERLPPWAGVPRRRLQNDASKWQVLADLGQKESNSLQFEVLSLQSGRKFPNIGTRCANNTPGLSVEPLISPYRAVSHEESFVIGKPVPESRSSRAIARQHGNSRRSTDASDLDRRIRRQVCPLPAGVWCRRSRATSGQWRPRSRSDGSLTTSATAHKDPASVWSSRSRETSGHSHRPLRSDGSLTTSATGARFPRAPCTLRCVRTEVSRLPLRHLLRAITSPRYPRDERPTRVTARAHRGCTARTSITPLRPSRDRNDRPKTHGRATVVLTWRNRYGELEPKAQPSCAQTTNFPQKYRKTTQRPYGLDTCSGPMRSAKIKNTPQNSRCSRPKGFLERVYDKARDSAKIRKDDDAKVPKRPQVLSKREHPNLKSARRKSLSPPPLVALGSTQGRSECREPSSVGFAATFPLRGKGRHASARNEWRLRFTEDFDGSRETPRPEGPCWGEARHATHSAGGIGDPKPRNMHSWTTTTKMRARHFCSKNRPKPTLSCLGIMTYASAGACSKNQEARSKKPLESGGKDDCTVV
jgi:hypothetical protein